MVDLGVESELRGLSVVPRQGRTSSRVKKIEFYLSESPNEWKEQPDCTLDMVDGDNEQSIFMPEPKVAKFVKMRCVEPMVAGEPYAALAELTPIVTRVLGDYPAHSFYSVAYTSSELPGIGAASNVLDGNPDTYWHTMKGVTLASFPHDIRLDLSEERKVKGIQYRGATMAEGRVKNYEIYVSNDGQNWGEPVARGQFGNSTELQDALFYQPASARYVCLVCLNAHDGGDCAALADLDIILE